MSAASRLCTPPALPGYTRASDELGGGGANGLVYRERDEASGEIVAVKYLYRAELTLVAHPNGKPPFQRELRNHALTGGHPLIAGFRRVELLQDWMAVVMELCEGANLLQWLNTQPRNRASEDVARGVVGQVLSAVHHMHSQNLAHRDLKHDNICVTAPAAAGAVPTLRVLDFGHSKGQLDSLKGNSVVGTGYYMAPELLVAYDEQTRGLPLSEYSTLPVDVWAIGMLLHVMLRGVYPFNTIAPAIEMAKNGTLSTAMLNLLAHVQPLLSTECTDFVTKCLQPNAKHRTTVAELMAHPWVASAVPVLAPTASQCEQTMAEVEDVIRRIEQGLL